MALQDLTWRVLSSLVLLGGTVPFVYVGGGAFQGLLLLLLIPCCLEWARISRAKKRVGWMVVAAVAGALLLSWEGVVLGGLGWLACWGGVFLALHIRRLLPKETLILLAVGAGYLFLSLFAASSLREIDNGLFLLIWLIGMVMGTDVGAYFSGRLIGGPKLIPVISPNKTWSGLLGGIMVSVLISLTVATVTQFGFFSSILVGVGVAIVAQAGDILESWLKRRAGLKDSGRWIPGHGGILDRVDGFLTATPLFWLVGSIPLNGGMG